MNYKKKYNINPKCILTKCKTTEEWLLYGQEIINEKRVKKIINLQKKIKKVLAADIQDNCYRKGFLANEDELNAEIEVFVGHYVDELAKNIYKEIESIELLEESKYRKRKNDETTIRKKF